MGTGSAAHRQRRCAASGATEAACSRQRARRLPLSIQRRPRGAALRGALMDAQYFVYILASGRNGTLYIGVTNHLARRVAEHKGGFVPGFTRKYRVDQLVYFEAFSS